jgi:hypothetical protein
VGYKILSTPHNVIEETPSFMVNTTTTSIQMYFLDGKWHCENCNKKGDRFDMEDHKCNGKKESRK